MASPGQAISKRPFTAAEEIGIAQFGDSGDEGRIGDIMWAPDRSLVAVHVGRGLADKNLVQSELRIYAASDLRSYASTSNSAAPIRPRWTITVAPYKRGPAIQRLAWCRNSRQFAFLQEKGDGGLQLYLADIDSKAVTALSRDDQSVTGFDVPTADAYVYSALSPKPPAADERPSEVLTGSSIWGILFDQAFRDRSSMWIGHGGKSTEIPGVTLFTAGSRNLALSPDGKSVLTELPVEAVPTDWPTRYVPSDGSTGYAMVAGRQHLDACCSGGRFVNRYTIISTRDGAESLVDKAPSADDAAGWITIARPAWSGDGHSLILPGLFMAEPGGRATPCIAVHSTTTGLTSCVERFHAPSSRVGLAPATELKLDENGQSIVVQASDASGAIEARTYHLDNSNWSLSGVSSPSSQSLQLEVRESPQRPPVLAIKSEQSREWVTVWDPNPQLASVDIGDVRPFTWKDSAGRLWHGGIYRPSNFTKGKRYPLVIQANYFTQQFRPSGIYPTAFAARQLAASGILVLQARCENVAAGSADEGPCQVRGYDRAVEILAKRGVIDPNRVGIVGFSRPSYFVLEALTKGHIRFKAASITSGVNEGYWEYLTMADIPGPHEEVAMNGGSPPLGSGLQKWYKNAPTFNMQNSHAALQVVSDRSGVFGMWEPYSLMRYMRKPVDLVLLNTNEHVLTEPKMRIVSQGGVVDWMRYWLQGYEDADPGKQDQYRRWEEMCEDQRAQRVSDQPVCVAPRAE